MFHCLEIVNKNLFFPLLLFLFVLPPLSAAEGEGGAPTEEQTGTGSLESFADPRRIWGNGIEGFIEEAYRRCFKTYIIAGRIMNLRLPFAENDERDKLSDFSWEFTGGGKGDPAFLWEAVDRLLGTEDFARYTLALSDGREKVIIFDISEQSWRVSLDLFDIARIKTGAYHGLPHKPYVLVSGRGVEEADVYNYLYCVGRAGVDCSGFVWYVLSSVARRQGLDLGRSFSSFLGLPRGAAPSLYVGTGVFDSSNPQITGVSDKISALRPGDIILFRGEDGDMVHSAIIQSVDFSRGLIRYLQSTDEALREERGVHESFIYFDPAQPDMSLKDPQLRWSQNRFPPFAGEWASPFSNDGDRYRAYPELGAGRVVRLRALGGSSR